VNGSLRLTEQGEVIAAKYAEPQMAQRNLEDLAGGYSRVDPCSTSKGSATRPKPAYEILDELADRAQRALFPNWCTTLKVSSITFLQSTPGQRDRFAECRQSAHVAQKPTSSISDLRAISVGDGVEASHG